MCITVKIPRILPFPCITLDSALTEVGIIILAGASGGRHNT